MALNCACRYATALSSPGVPGARPSIESDARSLMCWSMLSALIACAALSAAAALRVLPDPAPESLPHAASPHARSPTAAATVSTETLDFIEFRVMGVTARDSAAMSRTWDWEG